MKTRNEIQLVHDLFHAVIDGTVELAMDKKTRAAFHASHDTLYWILGCPAGETFKLNIDALQKAVTEDGVKVRKLDA